MKTRIYNEAIRQLNSIKRLPANIDYICGLINVVFRYARVVKPNDITIPIPREYLDSIIDAIYTIYYGSADIEPEFEIEKEYEQHQYVLSLIYNNIVWSSYTNHYIALK